MSEKKAIRIVKKRKNTRPSSEPKINSAREAAREMAGMVTNWVTEFQERRHTETANAFRIHSRRGLTKNFKYET